MLRLAIIADDLTGALDAAAPFAASGLRVRVATRPDAMSLALDGADIVAVSTRSREIAPGEAGLAVAGVLAQLPPGIRLFKKVDSRLKGHIAAELAAFGPVPLLAVPALPEFGRLVQGGAVCGHGVATPIEVAGTLGAAATRATIPDITTPAQMLAAIAAAPAETLIVGARGAALALAGLMGLRAAPLAMPELPMMIVVGSTDAITLAQVAHLRASVPGLEYVAAPNGMTGGAAASHAVTLLQAVPDDTTGPVSGPQVAAALAASLASRANTAATMVLTGGATAEAALDALGLTVLDLRGDLLPGLPLSIAGGWQIITKSGGFGGPDTLTLLAKGAGAA